MAMETWARGWAITREVPPPVVLAGSLRLDVGLPEHRRRYVMTDHRPAAIRSLVRRIRRPWVYVKVPAPARTVAPLLPPHWIIDEEVVMMTGPVGLEEARLPPGYTLSMDTRGDLKAVDIRDGSGAPAARGRAAAAGPLLVFDQIVTEEAHRRRGLGRCVMAVLGRAGLEAGVKEGLLVATEDGAALYRALGWSVLVPVTSAVMPDDHAPHGG